MFDLRQRLCIFAEKEKKELIALMRPIEHFHCNELHSKSICAVMHEKVLPYSGIPQPYACYILDFR
jgi:hypothetical protein